MQLQDNPLVVGDESNNVSDPLDVTNRYDVSTKKLRNRFICQNHWRWSKPMFLKRWEAFTTGVRRSAGRNF
jgi:hypothetical protein